MTEFIKTEFFGKGETRGWRFSCIRNGKFSYIYQVDGHNSHFETFCKKSVPLVRILTTCEKRIYEPIPNEFKEVYPTSKSFGHWAWTFNTLEKAIEKFNKLEEKGSQNEII